MIKISSKDNVNLKYLHKLIKKRKFRDQENLFVVEGIRICLEAIEYCKTQIQQSFISESFFEKYPEYVNNLQKKSEKLFIVSDDILSKFSDTQNPQGVICICQMLDKSFSIDKIRKSNKYILLENISDPGNMGMIMRTAEALNISAMILCESCTDPYSPKTVRASMGAIFRLPIYYMDKSKDAIDIFKSKEIDVYATVPCNDAEKLSEINFAQQSAFIIGNEGNGLLQETIEYCEKKVTIDMLGRAESLNAGTAATILLWEMCKPVRTGRS